MDANGARFWLLAGAKAWAPLEDPDRVRWDTTRGALRLSSQGGPGELTEDATAAAALRERCPVARDTAGALARVIEDPDPRVEVRVAGDLPATIFRSVFPISSVTMGSDGGIGIVAGGIFRLRDARTLADPEEAWRGVDPGDFGITGFSPWRAAAAPDGGGWLLDRVGKRLARWRGTPLRNRPRVNPAPGTFKLSPEDPEVLSLNIAIEGVFGAYEPAALAVSTEGRVVVLGLAPETAGERAEARAWVFGPDGRGESGGGGRGPPGALPLEFVADLAGVHHPVSVAWAAPDRIAVIPGVATADAIVYPIGGDDPRIVPVGDRYPLRDHDGGPFVHGVDGLARYLTAEGDRRLVALSLPRRAESGRAAGIPLDSGDAAHCWHRLMVEAGVPDGCAIRLWLAASDDETPPEEGWFPHDIGAAPPPDTLGPTPRAAWVPARSELPDSPGLWKGRYAPGVAGLFSVLVQRRGFAGTRLVGRYLHVRAELFGDGRTSPELCAVRAWGDRFSYVRKYLPALYHEDPLLDPATPGPATAPDFFERFVALFEGILTPIEDRVIAAHQLTNPRVAPAAGLDWLASWLGFSLDPALPEDRRRRLVAALPTLARWRGTARGLELAVDLVSGGGVADGRVVIVEEWRLRRTLATILGADFADEDDPLLEGLVVSANSLVGDTLVLGDEHHREFLALFGPETAEATAEFFRRAAWRVTALLSDQMDPADRGLVERLLATEAPAHVVLRVRAANQRFVAGLSALVGVDTRLSPEPPVRTVRLGHSRLGAGDRVRRAPGLHPDFEGAPG